EVRFPGPTAELLDRPDVLRSVFLEGAASREQTAKTTKVRTNGDTNGNGAVRRVVLETRDLTKSFSGIRAVDSVSLQLHEGEILGVIGPNGAGKTTLFDIISGFLVADRGSIFLCGDDVAGLRPAGRSNLG